MPHGPWGEADGVPGIGILQADVEGGACEDLEVLRYAVCHGQAELKDAVDGAVRELPFTADAERLYLNLIAPAGSPAYACAETEAYGIFKR